MLSQALILLSLLEEMSATVLATDILPTLYSNEEEERESNEDVMDDLNYDIYNLVAFNYHSVRITGEGEEREEAILDASIRATQLLVKRLGPLNSNPCVAVPAKNGYCSTIGNRNLIDLS